MRGLPLLVGILVASALLAGCNQAPPETGAQDPTGDDPGRTARGSPGSGDEDSGDEPELEPVELLRTPLTIAGQGPESFELTVPDGIVRVDFGFVATAVDSAAGLRVELTDCGSYDSGLGSSSNFGGGSSWAHLCDDAAPGPATVTISATMMVFDGTFVLMGYTPAANATAPPANATAMR
jgi:hypothetical protein